MQFRTTSRLSETTLKLVQTGDHGSEYEIRACHGHLEQRRLLMLQRLKPQENPPCRSHTRILP
jgi:hypothetical protein